MPEVTETLVDGRYKLLDRLGSGGMADVYRAEDTQLAREVALKVLHRRFARDEQFVERFRREASSAAGLQHPHVVSVYDRGEHDGTYYIAMEHLDGRTLKELIAEDAPIAQERAIDIGVQILQAAAFAHRRGVIHRDFKPQNVIVDSRDDVKVTDFGIARAGASEITETGSILGTAQYLSPEQAQGEATTASSDIYSIGVILYELIAGRLPFEGDSAVAIAVKHLTEEPPRLSELRPDVHPGLEAAVMRALAKDPKERWSDAEELMSALQAARAQIAMGDQGQGTAQWAALPPLAAAGEDGQPEGEERRPWYRRRLLLLLIPLLLAAGALAFFLLRGNQVPVPELVGDQLAEAQPELERAGFRVAVERETDPAPLNEVIEQAPAPGAEAEEGSTVTLVVSEGPGQAKVPDLVGLSQEQAVERLDDRGFRASIDREFSAEVPADQVARTVPRAGIERTRGSAIQVIVSSGAREVEVPDVTGDSDDAALATLEAAGFQVATERVEADARRGEVIDQTPAAGTRVDEGSQVSITVSSGTSSGTRSSSGGDASAPRAVRDQRDETSTVPNVVGLASSEARAELRAAGFGVSVREEPTTDEDQDGTVIRQSPSGGSDAERGANVVIVVGRFEEPRPDGGGPDDGASDST